MSMFTTRTTIFFVNNVVGEFQHEIIASVEPPAITAEIRPTMTLSVDQIINWDYQINPKKGGSGIFSFGQFSLKNVLCLISNRKVHKLTRCKFISHFNRELNLFIQ